MRNLRVELMPYCFMCRRHVTWTAPGRFSCGHADPRPRNYNEPEGEHIDVYPPVRMIVHRVKAMVGVSWCPTCKRNKATFEGRAFCGHELEPYRPEGENPILYGIGKPCSDTSPHEPHGYNDPDTRVRYLCLGVG